MREITVMSTLASTFKVLTSATTLGDLINETSNNFSSSIDVNNMRFKVRGATETLELSSALPAEDFILFASPKKSKSGK